MTLTAFLDGSDIGTTRVRLGDFGLSTRADGTGAFGSIVFDDPDGTMTVRGWMPIYLEDDECEAAPRLFTGWIWDRTYRRGPYRHGAGREIECQLLDTNALLSFILITNPDGKRPAETHNERINWLLASYLLGLVVDNGLVNDSNPRPFGEADYRPQYPNDVLNDIAGPIFRTYFTYWDQDQEEVALFFDIPVATTFTSDLTISNVLSDTGDIDDPDTECFPPMVDAELSRSPSEVYALIYYRYAKGVVIEKNFDTFNEFFPDLGYRGLAVENSRIGSEASARIMAQTLLTRYSGEADTVTVTVRLPPSKAGLIDAGQRIGVRFTHLPGYDDAEDFIYTRVTARTIKQALVSDRDGTRRYYDLTLELNTHGLTSLGGGPPPGDFPQPPPPDLSPDATGDVCNTVVEDNGRIGNADIPVLAVEGDDWYFEVVQTAHSAGAQITGLVLSSDGVSPSTIYNLLTLWTSAEIGFGAGSAPLPLRSGTFTVGSQVGGGADVFHLRVDADYLGPGVTVDECFHIEMWRGTSRPTAPPPEPGQTVPWTVVDVIREATTTVGVTAAAYADLSLQIKVDGVLISTASYEETDPTCGLFTLLWVLDPDEVVTVTYQGR